MYTYEDIELLAAELVATADLHTDDKDHIIEMCLLAGEMRGLTKAGAPVNTQSMDDLIDTGFFWLGQYREVA